MPRTQANSENCVAHNGNLLPAPGRDVMVQAWYQGGVSVIDWTDGTKVKELAYFDRGPYADRVPPSPLAGSWSSYWYNGKIYSNEIQRGFDVLDLTAPARANTGGTLPYLNAQTQEPLQTSAAVRARPTAPPAASPRSPPGRRGSTGSPSPAEMKRSRVSVPTSSASARSRSVAGDTVGVQPGSPRARAGRRAPFSRGPRQRPRRAGRRWR